MRRENNLGTDSMGGLVVRLAIPAMLAQFINVLYSIVDRIFIGNIPEIGATALAGVGICGANCYPHHFLFYVGWHWRLSFDEYQNGGE